MALKITQNYNPPLQEQKGNWFKLHDAAELLAVSEITLRRKIKSGKLISELRDGKYFVFLTDKQYKVKKKQINNIEKYLAEKEEEIKILKTQIFDQKILISALEEKINKFIK